MPIPAGSHVIHYAKGVHFDSAKDEPATILVWGEGPATSTPFSRLRQLTRWRSAPPSSIGRDGPHGRA